MNFLVIYAHPNEKSFNNAVKEVAVKTIKDKGHNIKIRDLYEEPFDPILKKEDFALITQGTSSEDVLSEQKLITWADIIVFIFPIWWGSFPAVLKGYIDRVFNLNFAYKMTDSGPVGMLKGKKVIIINTTGGDKELYSKMNMFESLKRTMDGNTFAFCGMEVIEHRYLHAVPFVDNDTRVNMLSGLVEDLDKVL